VNRLLSPNEAKFWLLDWVSPMNSIVVIQSKAGFRAPEPSAFTVPEVRIGRQNRPRWGEASMRGVVRRETVSDDQGWLSAAEELQHVRVGTQGHPPWHAVVQEHPSGFTLILAVNHALTDWRTSLHVAHCFADGRFPGALAPPCEELLPDTTFGDPDAGDLIEDWWTGRTGAAWEAVGLEKLTAAMPRAANTRFAMIRVSEPDTERLKSQCETEGVSLNNALAVAIRDVMGLDAVAHSVDMARFVRPALPVGPGLAVAHIFTRVTDSPYWEAARDNRAELFDQIRSGAAGDALLALPRALAKWTDAPAYQVAEMTVTGAPTVSSRSVSSQAADMQLVLSSARGGGGILILSYFRGQLQLVSGTPEGQPDVPLAAIVDNLLSNTD